MKVYKVVRQGNNGLFSAIVNADNVCLRYAPGLITRPKIEGSLIAAFKTPHRATSFSGCNCWAGDLQVWEAEAVVSRGGVAICVVPTDLSADFAKDIWEKTRRSTEFRAQWPEDTVFCKGLTLTQRVFR